MIIAAALLLLVEPSPIGDVAQIRAARAATNAAIGKHDFSGVARFLSPDYTILSGALGLPLDVKGYEQRLERDLKDPTFNTYVRTPERIVISDSRKRAAETGRWTGTFRKPDGTMHLSGFYQATWVPTADGWLLKNESFVTLHCTGSRFCTERN